MSNQDSQFFRTFSMVMIALSVLFIVIVIAALTVTNASKKEGDAAQDPRVQAKVNEIIKPVAQVNTDASATAAPAPAAGGAIDGAASYQSACFACHGTGAAGAPKTGDKGAWKARIAQGKATLYDHAIKGFKGMPPKGGSQLSDDAMKAVVDYMINQSK